jgi:membrane associated rhomboid family serine protease
MTRHHQVEVADIISHIFALKLTLTGIGLAVNGYVGGLDAAIWTALGGLVVAIAVCGITAMALVKARQGKARQGKATVSRKRRL